MLRWNAQPPRLPRIGAWGHWEWTSTAHIDLGETDRFGNVVGARFFPVELSKKTRAQVTAALGEVAADIVDWARLSGKPLVVEELDFRKKKAALRERSPRYARMRSAFAYRKFSAFVLPGCPGRSGDRRGEPGVHQRPRRGQVCLGLRAVIPLRGGGGDSPPGPQIWGASPVQVRLPATCTESREARLERLEACGPEAAGRTGPWSVSLRGRSRQGDPPILGGTRQRLGLRRRPALGWFRCGTGVRPPGANGRENCSPGLRGIKHHGFRNGFT